MLLVCFFDNVITIILLIDDYLRVSGMKGCFINELVISN